MTATDVQTQEEAAFRAVLYPHRSLGPRGFLILMTAVGVVSFVAGMVFLWMGAWPVFGFFGLDALLIYFAFRTNYRDGNASELVELNHERLILTRCDPKGRKKTFSFNPYWVKVLFSEHTGGQTSLALTSHGQVVEFGQFLNNDERREFAAVLKDRLAMARARPG